MRISIQYTFGGIWRRLCCILSYSTFGIQRILLHTMYVVYIWQVIDIKYICVEKIIHEILDWLAKPKGNTSKKKTFFTRNKHQFDLILCVLILQYFFISTFYESRKWYQIVVWTVFEVHINVLQNNNDLANGYFICYAMCHSVTV